MHHYALQKITDNKDIYDKIRDGYYDHPTNYPSRPHKPRLSVDHNHSDVLEYAGRMKIYESDKVEFSKAMDIYRARKRQQDDLFMEDVIEYCGLFGHPKAPKAFNMARERGDGRLASIVDELQELADLILDQD